MSGRSNRQRLLRAAKVVETFLAEAAVLLAVFPVPDEFVQRGRGGVTLRLVVFSGTFAAILLGVAVALAVATGEE